MVHVSDFVRESKGFATRFVLEGYGPRDLISRVKTSPWLRCLPSGRNFSGIALGGMVLADCPDSLSPNEYRITLEAVPTGDSFTVEGYQTPHMFDSLRLTTRPCTFSGCELISDYVGDVTAYRVTVERLAPAFPERQQEYGQESLPRRHALL